MKVNFFEKFLIWTNLFMFFLLTSYFLLLTILTTAPALVFADEIPTEFDSLPPEVRQAVVVEATGKMTARVSGWERNDARPASGGAVFFIPTNTSETYPVMAYFEGLRAGR